MFKFSQVVVLIFILSATIVHPQDYPTLMGRGNPVMNKTFGIVLYEQLANVGPNSFSSQNFETILDAFDNQLADDFIVPAGDGTWTIESLEVLGIYFNGTGSANSVNIWFYNDSLGLPGSIAASRMDVVPTAGSGNRIFHCSINITSNSTIWYLLAIGSMQYGFSRWRTMGLD